MYNEELNIESALDSFLAQVSSVSDLELIVVDNESSDRSYEIAKATLDNFNCKSLRADLYRIGHCSLSESRNFAISKSQGEYVFFIDSDAVVCDGWLEEVIGVLDRCDPGKDYIFSGRVLNSSKSSVSKLFFESMVKQNFCDASTSFQVIGANMGFSANLLSNFHFIKGYTRGDESALVAQIFRDNYEVQKINVPNAVVANQFPDSLASWLVLFFREGFNREKIDHQILGKKTMLRLITWFLALFLSVCLVYFSLSSSLAWLSVISVLFLLIFLANRGYLWLVYYSTKLLGRFYYMLRALLGREIIRLDRIQGVEICHHSFFSCPD